jgi:hypothetical protein
MPSKSDKQAKVMAAAANNPKFGKTAGIPQKVAKDFHRADTTGTKFKTPKVGAGRGKKK